MDYCHVCGLLICVALASSSGSPAEAPENEIQLSPLQRALDQARAEWTIPEKDRDQRTLHYFRRKTLSFKPDKVKEQITAYEMKNRQWYDEGPFNVYEATGKTGKDAAWEKWLEEVFTIEQDWAAGLSLPFFCRVLRIRDDQGNQIRPEELSQKEYLERSTGAARAILKPLIEAARDPVKAKELQQTPMYVVKYIGNFEGNGKFVKLYIGKRGTADFLVFDVSVYDHY